MVPAGRCARRGGGGTVANGDGCGDSAAADPARLRRLKSAAAAGHGGAAAGP